MKHLAVHCFVLHVREMTKFIQLYFFHASSTGVAFSVKQSNKQVINNLYVLKSTASVRCSCEFKLHNLHDKNTNTSKFYFSKVFV